MSIVEAFRRAGTTVEYCPSVTARRVVDKIRTVKTSVHALLVYMEQMQFLSILVYICLFYQEVILVVVT